MLSMLCFFPLFTFWGTLFSVIPVSSPSYKDLRLFYRGTLSLWVTYGIYLACSSVPRYHLVTEG
ncbi:hypothetical protein F4802DRAFT_583644 [Xylaria palmicola]|nr:hypothetical protein F4802DRAFT_583644 [Xylaria palmicola]